MSSTLQERLTAATAAIQFGPGDPDKPSGVITPAEQQIIAKHYQGWLPQYDWGYFLVSWQQALPNGNAQYAPMLPSNMERSADASAVAYGSMTQAQFSNPKYPPFIPPPELIGWMRTPEDIWPPIIQNK